MLEIKRKHLDRREWYGDAERDFRCMYHRDGCFEGGIGLITFTGLSGPDEVDTDDGRLCIADNGYQWLELAPAGGRHVLTAMFRDGRLFQIYIDITSGNEVSANGDAEFGDMFVDVVIKDDVPRIVDVRELEDALSRGVISGEDCRLAMEEAGRVVDRYNADSACIKRRLYGYRALFAC